MKSNIKKFISLTLVAAFLIGGVAMFGHPKPPIGGFIQIMKDPKPPIGG